MNKRLVFSRSFRLVNKKDFQFVFAKPYKSSSRYVRAFFRLSQHEHARLGIIVAKTVIKRAVDRNLIRRVVRESFRHHQDMLKGLDIVAVIRSECNPQKASTSQKIDKHWLRDDVDQLWQHIFMLVNGSKLG